MTPSAFRTIPCRKLSGGRFSPAKTGVIIEKELPVYVNGRHLFTASITPGMEKEFVAGYLFGQGFIRSAGEIKSLEMEKDGAKVVCNDDKKASSGTAPASYRIVSGGGKMAFFDASSFPAMTSAIKVNKADVFRAMNTLFAKAPLYRATDGVHAAGLFKPEASPICVVEDIGRHNSLDKAIGYALLNGIDCSGVFLVSTGRMASEMVMKIYRAGIPLAATKTAVTDEGLGIAKKCGMTLIGFVRDAGTKMNTDMAVRTFAKAEMQIYCGVERVEGTGIGD
jgi:FdhD protein